MGTKSARIKPSFALFGGSFDPVHLGHVALIRAVQKQFGFEPLILMPTRQQPLKQALSLAPEHRLAMLEEAVTGVPSLVISDYELRSPSAEPNYTFDTLTYFKDQYPGAEPHLVLGSDSFTDLPQWYRFSELIALSSFIIGVRPGYPVPSSLCEQIRQKGHNVYVLEDPLPEISSTAVRHRLKTGESLQGLVTPSTLEYLKKITPHVKAD